ncbi:MAG: hypothetical protein U1B78_00715, partial [Dehalococcoidia bacterium]|nr:hypothetical protein [Dehalococcoidia bacterium]
MRETSEYWHRLIREPRGAARAFPVLIAAGLVVALAAAVSVVVSFQPGLAQTGFQFARPAADISAGGWT